MGCTQPEFLGIGVQKGGTTTLHELLKGHPGVVLPSGKELHYFSLHYSLGEAWYAGQFTTAREGMVYGEITPYYIFHPLAASRIFEFRPQMKLIVLLRDPVERALSQLFHSQRLGLDPLDPLAALEAEAERLVSADAVIAAGGRHSSHQEHSYLARSRYEFQLARYQALFPAEQLLVLRSEDLFEKPQRLWERVQLFLGIDEIPMPSLPKANAGHQEAKKISVELRQQLRARLAPTYQVIADNYDLCWD